MVTHASEYTVFPLIKVAWGIKFSDLTSIHNADSVVRNDGPKAIWEIQIR